MSPPPHLGASCSTRARRARGSSSSTRSGAAPRRVADEHLRPLPGTDAALAIGMMRAVVDAGLHDEDWCRASRRRLRRAARRVGGPVEDCAAIAGWTPRRSPASAATSPRPGRRCCGSAWAPSASRRSRGLLDDRLAARAHRRVGDRGGGCSYIPIATAPAAEAKPALEREDRGRPGAADQHVASSARRYRRRADPPVKALVCWNSNRRRSPPTRSRCWRATSRRPVPGRPRAVHDGHRGARGRGAAGHHAARAPRRVFSWGHHYLTWNEPAIEPLGGGEAEHRDLPPAGRAAGPRRSLLRRGARRGAGRRAARGVRRGRLRERGWPKIDLGQGPLPHADGGFGTETGAVALLHALRASRRGGGRGLPARFPLALITPKTAPVPQLDASRTSGASTRPSRSPRSCARRRRAGASRTAAQVGCSTTAARFCAARSPTTRVGLVAPMGWWNATMPRGAAPRRPPPRC